MTSTVNDLIRELTDPDESVRRYAAEDMADLRDPLAVPALVGALSDPSAAVREVVVDALVAIGGVESADAILPALRSEDPACRNAACEALRGIGAEAIGSLARVVSTGERDVRLFALDVLGLIGGPGAGEALFVALRDPDPNVGAAAATALGQVGGPAAVPQLVAALTADPWVRCAVATSLGRIGGRDATAALVGLLDDPDDTVGYVAAQALGACGGPAAAGPLAVAIGSQNVALVLTALDALDRVTERLTPAEARELRGRIELGSVRAILTTDDRTVHSQAVRVLGRLIAGGAGDSKFVPPVVRATGDQKGAV